MCLRGRPAPPRMWATAPRTALRPSRSTRKRQSLTATRSGLQGPKIGCQPSLLPTVGSSSRAPRRGANGLEDHLYLVGVERVTNIRCIGFLEKPLPEQHGKCCEPTHSTKQGARCITLTRGQSLRRRTRGGLGGSHARAGARSRQ